MTSLLLLVSSVLKYYHEPDTSGSAHEPVVDISQPNYHFFLILMINLSMPYVCKVTCKNDYRKLTKLQKQKETIFEMPFFCLELCWNHDIFH